MSDHPRIDELRRRVQRDPASLAFAHLAEEYRRAGRFEEAIATCRAGLKVHPSYVSAKVTLGRALIEIGDLDAAHAELRAVVDAAPDNLAAIRGLAEIHQRRGEHQEALECYRWAQEFAGEDTDLARRVQELEAVVRQPAAATRADSARSGPPAPPDTAGETHEPDASETPVPQAVTPQEAAGAAPAVEEAGRADTVHTQRQLEAFQRFLDAIVADRERRHECR